MALRAAALLRFEGDAEIVSVHIADNIWGKSHAQVPFYALREQQGLVADRRGDVLDEIAEMFQRSCGPP